MENNTTKPLFRGTQIIWYILTIIEVVLLLRFVLRLLAANPNAGFTDFIYSFSLLFVAPFQAVFRNTAVQGGSVFEWTTLLAMIVYYVLALILIKLLVMGKPVSSAEADSKLSAQDTTGQTGL